MQFSDETLMAYADDEVDADLRRQIEAAMALDPSIAERIAKHRNLRVDLGAAFNGVLDEPIPDRLLDAADSSPTAATVTNLNAARAAKQRAAHPRRWSWVEWTSIAASLVIGILAGPHSAAAGAFRFVCNQRRRHRRAGRAVGRTHRSGRRR